MSPKGYAEKWAEKMTEAYKIASEHSQQSSLRNKAYCDQKSKGVVLKPGDRVLVKNLREKGGLGKLRSYWERAIYVVKEQVGDNPVYIVSPESGEHRSRTLHRNLLLLVNDLPVDPPQCPTTPAVSKPHRERNRQTS